MKYLLYFCLLLPYLSFSQTTISGKISDSKSPLAGANIFIKGTFEGTTSDENGIFKFTTTQKDTIILSASFMDYQEWEKKIILGRDSIWVEILLLEPLKEDIEAIAITAGSFEVSDTKKGTVLNSRDIVTVAGSQADIFLALQTLPGATRVGDQEGLFIRGGSASEAKAVFDGAILQNPFFSSVPSIAQRSRFAPNLFKGTSFSTGGYSAKYGQALSSIIELNTTDFPDKTQLNAGINLAGINAEATKKWENTSLAVSGNYTNTAPLLFALNKPNFTWQTPPQGASSAITFRQKLPNKSILKAYINYDQTKLGVQTIDPFNPSIRNTFNLNNKNLYSNLYLKRNFNKWTMERSVSYSRNADAIFIDNMQIRRGDSRYQTRFLANFDIHKKANIVMGTELHRSVFYSELVGTGKYEIRDTYWANFAESEIRWNKLWITRIGIRGEYSSVIGRWNVAPRASFAYKTGENSQISGAFGMFYQNPHNNYLFINKNLDFEKALHYILNYQYQKNDRTFRIEAYQKDYKSLVREQTNGIFEAIPNRFPTGLTDNSGFGYARGIDVFWRDKKSIKNADFWVSYSFLDTKRLHMNYLNSATPTFASKHNFSAVYKHFLPDARLSLNAAYNYASGRTYYNPNNEIFMGDKTPDFHNVSITIAYLTHIRRNFTILYLALDNVLNRENIFGYMYSQDGSQRVATQPNQFRSVFVGMMINFSKK
ncbi:MAG: carboxypeptidase-like regulatory domain-containing protein [Raineya sp.]|jgi:hypothetical protein|nr:carboxypeptidase-like regulatory domain-containing protein [Raineya sp.]